MKETFTILVQGYDGSFCVDEKEVSVHCSEDELNVVAKALMSFFAEKYERLCCVASKGEYVSNNEFDYTFCDCM